MITVTIWLIKLLLLLIVAIPVLIIILAGLYLLLDAVKEWQPKTHINQADLEAAEQFDPYTFIGVVTHKETRVLTTSRHPPDEYGTRHIQCNCLGVNRYPGTQTWPPDYYFYGVPQRTFSLVEVGTTLPLGSTVPAKNTETQVAPGPRPVTQYRVLRILMLTLAAILLARAFHLHEVLSTRRPKAPEDTQTIITDIRPTPTVEPETLSPNTHNVEPEVEP